MKGVLRTTILLGLLSAAGISLAASQTQSADTSPLLEADHSLEQAFAKADKSAAADLLDTAFTWTDSAGKISMRAQVLATLPSASAFKLGATGDAAQRKEYVYGKVGVVQINENKLHVLRVWVLRPAGWRALVYQEVKSLDAPATITPGAGKVCENPCKTVSYRPRTTSEQAVVASYEALETAAVAHDAPGWAAHVADEFAAASSNSDQLLDKATRLAGLEHEKMVGVSPTPLTSARMFDFGDAVVMLSLHNPDRGKPLHITRVWINRNGNWVETLSYQTAIQSRPPLATKSK